MTKERIQKALARQGLGSRRQIENWIKEGQIRLNGQVVELGQLVETGDVVIYNGRKIHIRDALETLPRVLMYHKPEGEVCTRSDPDGRPTIFDKLPPLKHSRWINVGRLDLNTSGLILLTDSGDLANSLMHPSNQIQREYAVRVMGKATPEQLKQLTHGVELEDGPARFEDIVERINDDEFFPQASGLNHWYHVVLMEGRNREVRRMWEAVGLKVSRLMRVRYGSVFLSKSLRPGRHKELEASEIRELAELVGIQYSKELKSAKSVVNARRAAKLKFAGRSAPRGVRQTTQRRKTSHEKHR